MSNAKSAAARKPKGLGRGLEALLGEDPATLTEDPAAPPGAPVRLPLDALQPGRYQPRTRMDESALQELADSITRHGIMQPLVVRPLGEGRYEIIAGERRFRAARLAGLEEVPVQVREVSDQNALAMALIENIQREDLNPLEEAQAIRRLIDDALRAAEVEVNVVMEVRSNAAILRLVDSTASLAFVSDLSAEGRPVIEVKGLRIERELGLVTRRGRATSRAAQAFADELRAGTPRRSARVG